MIWCELRCVANGFSEKGDGANEKVLKIIGSFRDKPFDNETYYLTLGVAYFSYRAKNNFLRSSVRIFT